MKLPFSSMKSGTFGHFGFCLENTMCSERTVEAKNVVAIFYQNILKNPVFLFLYSLVAKGMTFLSINSHFKRKYEIVFNNLFLPFFKLQNQNLARKRQRGYYSTKKVP